MHSRLVVLLAVGIAAGAGCGGGGDGGGGTGPEGPGEVSIRLTVPAGTVDGIALVQVSGGTVAQVRSRGLQFRAVGVGGTTVHVIARGSLQGSLALAAVCLPRVEDLENYTAQLLQVAAGQAGGYVKRDITPYAVTLDPSSVTPVASC